MMPASCVFLPFDIIFNDKGNYDRRKREKENDTGILRRAKIKSYDKSGIRTHALSDCDTQDES